MFKSLMEVFRGEEVVVQRFLVCMECCSVDAAVPGAPRRAIGPFGPQLILDGLVVPGLCYLLAQNNLSHI